MADGSRTRSGLEPGGSASLLAPDIRTVLDALATAADYLRDRVSGCGDCRLSPADLCGTCEHRLGRLEAFGALARLLGGEL